MASESMNVRRGAVLIAMAGLLLIGLVPSGAHAGSYDGRYKERWQMLKATNHSRFYHERQRVDLNKELSDLARKHSARMAKSKSLFHVSDPATYYLKGRNWHWWGENVGVTGGTVADVERAFMHSDGHRANILNRTFDHVAIGAVRVDGVLWVTVFFWG